MPLANTGGVIGAANDRASDTPLFNLGTVAIFGNNSYTYAKAAAAVAAAGTVNLTGGFATGAGSTYTHDVPAPGVLINQFAFFKRAATGL